MNLTFIKEILHNILQVINNILQLEFFQSNTFNFIVVILLLAYIIIKIKFGSVLTNGVNKVKETIDNSVSAKEDSILKLNEAQDKISNIQEEIKEIEENNKKAILKSEEKIKLEGEKQVEAIESNTGKILEAKEKEIISKLSKKTITASIELAKEHIIRLLEKHPEYHQHFIEESIKELDRLN